MSQKDFLQLFRKPAKGLGIKEAVEKQSDLLQNQFGPVSWKGQDHKSQDSEKLLKCEKAVSGGKQKFSENILGENVV